MSNSYAKLDMELTTVLVGLDTAQTQWRPPSSPQKWSIQQIVEHLLLSYRSTYSIIQQRIDKGTATRASPSVAQRLGQLAIIKFGEFPSGRPAPAAVMPAEFEPAQAGTELVTRAHDLLGSLSTQSIEAGQIFGQRRFASHLVLGPLSLPQWSRFHLIHGRHHIHQIQAICTAHR